MARYNTWQNENLLATCDSLPSDALTEDRGLFFKSVLATLDHILNVDQVLLEMTRTGKIPPFDPNLRSHATYADFKKARSALDAEITSLCENAGETWFEDDLPRESPELGRTRLFPRWFYIAQMLNHQTHHRSQITSEFHRMGIDYGNTDMPFNPLTPY
eukprot:s1_g1285.t1